MPKSKPKVRETERLIDILAEVIRKEDETIADAKRALRLHLAKERIKQGQPEVVLLREMWRRLKDVHAHRDINSYIAQGYLPQLSFAEFEAHKTVLKRFGANVRRYLRNRKQQQMEANNA